MANFEHNSTAMFPRIPTEGEIAEWKNKITYGSATIDDVPQDIRDYIAITLGV